MCCRIVEDVVKLSFRRDSNPLLTSLTAWEIYSVLIFKRHKPKEENRFSICQSIATISL